MLDPCGLLLEQCGVFADAQHFGAGGPDERAGASVQIVASPSFVELLIQKIPRSPVFLYLFLRED